MSIKGWDVSEAVMADQIMSIKKIKAGMRRRSDGRPDHINQRLECLRSDDGRADHVHKRLEYLRSDDGRSDYVDERLECSRSDDDQSDLYG